MHRRRYGGSRLWGVLIEEFREWLERRWGSGRTLVNNVAAKPIKFQPLTFCLGRSVRIDSGLGIVMVTGEQYINDMYKRYMDGPAGAIVKTFKAEVPCEEGIMKLSTISERQLSEAASLTRSLVQSLAYGATKFKNEILFHVGRLQRFADNPCDDVYLQVCVAGTQVLPQGQAVRRGVVALERRREHNGA